MVPREDEFKASQILPNLHGACGGGPDPGLGAFGFHLGLFFSGCFLSRLGHGLRTNERTEDDFSWKGP